MTALPEEAGGGQDIPPPNAGPAHDSFLPSVLTHVLSQGKGDNGNNMLLLRSSRDGGCVYSLILKTSPVTDAIIIIIPT